MPRIRTEEFMNRVASRDFKTIRLKGVQAGSWYLMLETPEDVFLILENEDGTMKEYPKVDHALVWLKRMTNLKEIIVDIDLWKKDTRK